MSDALDRRVLEVVDAVACGEMPAGIEDDPLAREMVETLGLLPYALEPARDIRPLPALPPQARVLRPELGRPSRWLYAMAATLALALVGASAWLGVRMQEGERRIARLEEQLAAAQGREATLTTVSSEIQGLEDRVRLMTAGWKGVCPLRPPMGASADSAARGMLYALDQQRWYLVADGLEPDPDRGVYTVWFLLEDGPSRAGSLKLGETGYAEIKAGGFPEGSRGVLVTLEPDDSSDRPQGPELLFGDAAEMIRL